MANARCRGTKDCVDQAKELQGYVIVHRGVSEEEEQHLRHKVVCAYSLVMGASKIVKTNKTAATADALPVRKQQFAYFPQDKQRKQVMSFIKQNKIMVKSQAIAGLVQAGLNHTDEALQTIELLSRTVRRGRGATAAAKTMTSARATTRPAAAATATRATTTTNRRSRPGKPKTMTATVGTEAPFID